MENNSTSPKVGLYKFLVYFLTFVLIVFVGLFVFETFAAENIRPFNSVRTKLGIQDQKNTDSNSSNSSSSSSSDISSSSSGSASSSGSLLDRIINGSNSSSSTSRASTNLGSASSSNELNNSKGTIKGNLIYPAGVFMAQRVCAKEITTKQISCTTDKSSTMTYSLDLTPGTYYVYATRWSEVGKNPEEKVYYDEVSECGLTYECGLKFPNPKPIQVKVNSGAVVNNVNPQNWYLSDLTKEY